MKRHLLYLVIIISIAASCGSIGPIVKEIPDSQKGPKEDGTVLPLASLRVPRGHLPPPGKCRIWIPGRPPGHQPRPESCTSALLNAPPGSWVITQTSGKYKVSILNRSKKSVVDEVKWYAGK